MNDLCNLHQSIYWCSESMHNGVKLADFVIEKGIAGSYAEVSIFPSSGRYSVGRPRVLALIYDVWRMLASQRAVYLELKEDDFRIIPVIHPHLLVHLCKSKSLI